MQSLCCFNCPCRRSWARVQRCACSRWAATRSMGCRCESSRWSLVATGLGWSQNRSGWLSWSSEGKGSGWNLHSLTKWSYQRELLQTRDCGSFPGVTKKIYKKKKRLESIYDSIRSKRSTSRVLLRSVQLVSWSCWARSAGSRCSVCPRWTRTPG